MIRRKAPELPDKKVLYFSKKGVERRNRTQNASVLRSVLCVKFLLMAFVSYRMDVS